MENILAALVLVVLAHYMLTHTKIEINVNIPEPKKAEVTPELQEAQKAIDEAYQKEQKEFVDTARAIQNLFLDDGGNVIEPRV